MIYVYYRFKENINAAQRFRIELPLKRLNATPVYFGNKRGLIRWLSEELFILTRLNENSIYIFNRWPTCIGFSLALLFSKCKVIMDIDDLIDRTENGKNFILRILFWYNKYCSDEIWCGNEFLLIHTNSTKSRLVPTGIPEELILEKKNLNTSGIITFGWTGQKSTLRYIEFLVPYFDILKSKYNFKLLYLSDEPSPILEKRSYTKFIKWSTESELLFFKQIQIGLMPLYSDLWCEGKCAFKLLQYLYNGKYAIASKTDLNLKISIKYFPDSMKIVLEEKDWLIELERVLKSNNISLVYPETEVFRTEKIYENLIQRIQYDKW